MKTIKIIRSSFISLLIITSMFTLTSCKDKNNTIVIGDDVEIVSPDKGLSINDETLDTMIKQFVAGKLSNTSETSWATGTLILDSVDKTSDNTEIISKYSNRNALYVKIHDITSDEYFTYRFQMNEENKVESYIRFQLMY